MEGAGGTEADRLFEKKDAYCKLTERRDAHSSLWWRWVGWWPPKPGRALRYWKLHPVMAFHDTRFQFIYYRNLDPAFHFASFLRKIKSATFIKLVEIHWAQYACMLLFVLLDIACMKLVGQSPIFEPIFLMRSSVCNMILVALLGSQIRRVYWKITKNQATYYDDVDRLAILEEALMEQNNSFCDRRADMRRDISSFLGIETENGFDVPVRITPYGPVQNRLQDLPYP